MSAQEPPKIEFPCPDYPVKVIGEASEAMKTFVLDATEQFAPGFNRNKVSVRESGKGRFQSVTVYITATGESQLKAFHQHLMANATIKMVL